MLDDSGIAVRDPGALWKAATQTNDGLVYDFEIGPGGKRPKAPRPIILRDPVDSKLFRIQMTDDEASWRLLRKSFPESRFRHIGYWGEREEVQLGPLHLELTLGPSQMRTALKMAFALAAKEYPEEVDKFDGARRELVLNASSDQCPRDVAVDFRDHPSLDNLRDDLCHTIYVEQYGTAIHGIVQFYGALQIYIPLAGGLQRDYEYAVLGTLNPRSGEEKFSKVSPLKIEPWKDGYYDALSLLHKLNDAARRSGCRTPALLSVDNVSVDGETIPPRRLWWTSWTGDCGKK